MHKAAKGLIVLAIIVVVVVLIFGFVGFIRVPYVSPKIQAFPGATEISISDVQRVFGQMNNFPSLTTMQSYGLIVHCYGTNQRLSIVQENYEHQVIGWTLELNQSGAAWMLKVWRHIAYGFGLMVCESALMKPQLGYNTIFVTVDGPLASWMPVLQQRG